MSVRGGPSVIIFGGVNGAGKTSLYEVLHGTEDLGTRISVDEIVSKLGAWQDRLIQLKAARIAREMISNCIERGESFHFESTLTGNSAVRVLECARNAGFTTLLYFVGIESDELAIKRVHRRIDNGGHGVDDSAIITRFRAMPQNLHRILPHIDYAYFYDNTIRFRQIAVYNGTSVLDEDPILPSWYNSLR